MRALDPEKGGARKTGVKGDMSIQSLWISRGRLEGLGGGSGPDDARTGRQLRDGSVQVMLSRSNITIRWHLFAPNWASLYYLLEWLPGQDGPCRLEYFAAGWFVEDYAEIGQVLERIRHLMDKSDIFLRSRVFIKPADMEKTKAPDLLQDVLTKGDAPAEYGVDCVEDPQTHAFKVSRIGERTPIAERWGMTPVSFPCMNGNDYDQLVSSIYPKVLKTGESHYDHVYAAMQENDGRVSWVPYQRIVLPKIFRDGSRGVRVVSKIAPVDIQVI